MASYLFSNLAVNTNKEEIAITSGISNLTLRKLVCGNPSSTEVSRSNNDRQTKPDGLSVFTNSIQSRSK